MKTLKLVFLLLLIGEISTFQVIFTKNFLKIHSTYSTDLSKIEKTAFDYVDTLENSFPHGSVRRKAVSCANLIRFIMVMKDNQTSHHIIKRGIPLIGELISLVADTPSPEDWHEQQQLTQDLIDLENESTKDIKFLNKKLNKTIRLVDLENAHLNKVQIEISLQANLTNSRIANSNAADELCYIGLKLAFEHGQKVEEIKDISLNSKSTNPSRYMFPSDDLHVIAESQALKNRIFSPVFLSQREIDNIYSLESTAIVYNPDTQTISGIILIPLADFSDMMTTQRIPNLGVKDSARLRSLELLIMNKLDLLLCSDKGRKVRLYSSSDLSKCQKHSDRNKGTYICSSREVYSPSPAGNCNDLKELPSGIAIEGTSNEFIIDSPKTNVTIYCEGLEQTNKTDIAIIDKPLKLQIPEHCS